MGDFLGEGDFFFGGGEGGPLPHFFGTNLLVRVKLGYTPVIWKCPKRSCGGVEQNNTHYQPSLNLVVLSWFELRVDQFQEKFIKTIKLGKTLKCDPPPQPMFTTMFTYTFTSMFTPMFTPMITLLFQPIFTPICTFS